jgi:hypothetical protein
MAKQLPQIRQVFISSLQASSATGRKCSLAGEVVVTTQQAVAQVSFFLKKPAVEKWFELIRMFRGEVADAPPQQGRGRGEFCGHEVTATGVPGEEDPSGCPAPAAKFPPIAPAG